MNIKYDVRIGSKDGPSFGTITANGFKDLYNKVTNQIENLHPLNSSEEGREIYRNRFRNKPIYVKEQGAKEYQLISKSN
ncbi:MAG: hypothetical protein IT245_06840 [Bacteroidia bacterium]|nr:hypothetical protein [Bacteroidia bacterium]